MYNVGRGRVKLRGRGWRVVESGKKERGRRRERERVGERGSG